MSSEKHGELIAQHDVELRALRSSIDDILVAVNDLRKVVSGIGRTDFKTLISLIGVMIAGFVATITVLSIVGGLVINPVMSKLSEHDSGLRELAQRAFDNRTLTLQAHESLRGSIIEQETQLMFFQQYTDIRIGELYAVMNADRIARGLQPFDPPELGRAPQRAEMPRLLNH